MEQMTSICDMAGQIMQKKEEEKRIAEEQAAKDRYWKIPICYDDDDDEESSIPLKDIIMSGLPPCVEITPDSPKSDSLIMEDEHLDTIPETGNRTKLIKSVLRTLSIPQVLDDIISIPPRNGNDHFNAESSPIESVLNRDNVISSPKIDLLIEEFAGELALIAPIPPGIVEANLDPKEDIRFIENLMYDNFFPRPLETPKDDFESVIDSNNDYSSSDDDSYEDIDYADASPPDSELVSLEVVEIVIPEVGGILILFISILDDDHVEEKSSGSTTTHADFSQYDSFIFDLSINLCLDDMSYGIMRSSSVNSLTSYLHRISFPSGTRNKIFDPGIFIGVQSMRFLSLDEFSISFIRDLPFPVIGTFLPFSSKNEDKVVNTSILAAGEEQYPHLSSHRGLKALNESPMMIYGENTPNLGVRNLHFYPP
ncbi:hypothetical protein Tco_0753460 [Tanacetum coccineum]